MKMLYKPLSMLVSVLGGILAGAVFKKVWAAVSGEQEAPEATSPEYSTQEVLVAAAVQGAIFAVVKAAVLERAKTDTIVGRTKVTALLTSLPGYGPAKVTALMQQTGIAPSRRIAGLGERQRQALCDALATTPR